MVSYNKYFIIIAKIEIENEAPPTPNKTLLVYYYDKNLRR